MIKSKDSTPREKCSYYKKYKAIYPPKCGCNACNEKYYKGKDLKK